jgi:Gas vesicle synthesis protein GvpO
MADSTKTRNRSRGGQEDGRPERDEEQEHREERADESPDREPRGEERDNEARDKESQPDDENGDNVRDRSGARLSAKELTEAAVSTIADLTGFEPESVAGLQWDGESWLVTVDVLELSRIPNTTDVLAAYIVQLDDSGELLGYKRTRRFLRSQVEGE